MNGFLYGIAAGLGFDLGVIGPFVLAILIFVLVRKTLMNGGLR